MRSDTLFRIASMTKPITSAAAMMLVEEGRIALSDPIARWVPELADLRVLRDAAGPLDDTVPARRAITVEDLLTHRSGIAYAPFSEGPLKQAYRGCARRSGDEPLVRRRMAGRARHAAARLSARRAFPLRPFDGRARLLDRPRRRQAVSPGSAGADLRAARHERYGLLASARKARPSREPVRV